MEGTVSVLEIDQIFTNLETYQDNLECIVKTPHLYYQPIDCAVLSFSCISQQKLYLGDLLQLWQQKNWLTLFSYHTSCSICAYPYAIYFDYLNQTTVIKAWHSQEKKHVSYKIKHAFDFYLAFIQLKRP